MTTVLRHQQLRYFFNALLRSSIFFVLLTSCVTNSMTGRRSLIVTSEREENKMGEDAYAEILSKERRTSNMNLARQIEEVGRRIAAVSGRSDYQWEFATLENAEPNAFCLPGGKVAVYTGIIPFAKNEAGLATVLGHEIGHALARHGGERISQQLGLNLGLGILSATALEGTKNKNVILSAIGIGATIGLVLPYSRSHETEADEMGLTLMARAGYDPRQAPEFWDRFAQASHGREPPEFLSTHPGSAHRRDRLSSLLPDAIVEYERASPKFGAGQLLN